MHAAPAEKPYTSIIIPTLNETAQLSAAIECAQCRFIEEEVIVVDAGSTDDTVAIATRRGCRVVETAIHQRAAQMNLGAKAARGEVLLFLHADTRLGSGSLLAIREALRDPRAVGGAFVRRYDSPSRVLAGTCWLTELRNRWFGWHLGDQAMFVRTHIFQRCGPFAEVDSFEDLDLSRRVAECGRLVTLLPRVISSARRFAQRGPVFTTARDFFLTCRYIARGLPPTTPREDVAPAEPAPAAGRFA